jgi:gamma-D-glutamyl-L-lysine dipeptidyl-peptidase
MPFSICIVPVAPMRSEAAHKSEQVSQLLFGELCEVLEVSKDFTKVKATYDHYEGWCQNTQLLPTDDNSFSDRTHLTTEWVTEIAYKGQPMKIPFGSCLSFTHHIPDTGVDISSRGEDTWQPGKEQADEALIKRFSFNYINTPYLWGGKSVFGVDCSGFTQVVFKLLGIHLQRDAYQQATQGEAIGFIQEAKCGDLAFFDNEEGRITHVGIMLDSNTIIHSSGKVRIDTIDHSGIVSSDTGIRTHKLRIIKRFI